MLAELLQQKLLEQRGVVHLRTGGICGVGAAFARQIVLLDKRRQRRRPASSGTASGPHSPCPCRLPVDKVQHREAGFRLRSGNSRRRRCSPSCPAVTSCFWLSDSTALQPVAQHSAALLKFAARSAAASIRSRACSPPQSLILAFQHQHHLLQFWPVIFRRIACESLAPGVAVPHVIVQAGPLLAEVAWELFAAAAAGFIASAQRVDACAASHTAAAERSEIPCAVIRDALLESVEHRIFLPQIDADVGIAFAVFQQDVVFRHVPLDQRAFRAPAPQIPTPQR